MNIGKCANYIYQEQSQLIMHKVNLHSMNVRYLNLYNEVLHSVKIMF